MLPARPPDSRPAGRGRAAATVSVRVAELAHDGRGMARLDGKAIFIAGALPEEQVRCRISARHSSYDEARLEAVEIPSPERVQPRCAHFAVCGGCSLQHLAAEQQIAHKQRWLLDNLNRIGKVQPRQVLEPLRGPLWGYRHKARLGVKYVAKKNKVLVGFRERNGSYLAELQRCEVLHPRIGTLLEALGELVGGLSIRDRVPQIEVAVGDHAAALNLRVLAPPDAADNNALCAFGQRHDLIIYLQPQGPASTTLLWPQQAALSYRLPAFGLELEFMPYHFIQINAAVNRLLVERAVDLLEVQASDRVLDLFCGLGNFTLAFARRAHAAVGVEGDAELVTWAGRNAVRNGIATAHFYGADLAQALGEPAWLQGPYDKLLLDPPRSGALALLPRLAALQVQRLVYISCHPATLARDAGELVHHYGYRLSSAGVIDMFPHTSHVESIALFERAKEAGKVAATC